MMVCAAFVDAYTLLGSIRVSSSLAAEVAVLGTRAGVDQQAQRGRGVPPPRARLRPSRWCRPSRQIDVVVDA